MDSLKIRLGRVLLKVYAPNGAFYVVCEDSVELDEVTEYYEAVGWNFCVIGVPLNWLEEGSIEC